MSKLPNTPDKNISAYELAEITMACRDLNIRVGSSIKKLWLRTKAVDSRITPRAYVRAIAAESHGTDKTPAGCALRLKRLRVNNPKFAVFIYTARRLSGIKQ